VSRAWSEIDLAAVRSNVAAIARIAGRGLIAVVKANAYGHGAVAVGRAALEAGARGLAVATVEEALELSEARVGPVLVLGALLEEEILAALAARAAVTVHSVEDLSRLARVARSLDMTARVHVEVDVGLARHGASPREALAVVEAALATPGVELEGLMCHLARAGDREAALEALGRFEPAVRAVRARAPHVVVHAAASTAALTLEEARFDLVRPGIALHGIDEGASRGALRQTLALRAKVVRTREVEAGTPVGYGATWTARRRTKLAIVGLGYDDGLPYRLSNRGRLLVRGASCPIVGTVMMDFVVCDVTDAPAVRAGFVATAIGTDGAESISVEEVARTAGVIPYVVTCGLGRRSRRVYLGERQAALTTSAQLRRLRSG
jgi:alanine racemase